MKQNQVKWGAVLSYILIIINTLYGLFLTPYILGQLGEAEYGVYKTISSFTSALMVLDIGIGGTMMRYIARFRADNEDKKVPNYIAMSFIQAAIICGIVAVISGGLFFSLDTIYSNGLTSAELVRAKQLYIFLALGVIFHIFENAVNGVITGYNCFIFANGVKVIRIGTRALALVILLFFFKNSLVIVLVDLFITIVLILIELLYIRFALRVTIRFSHWEGSLFKESFRYTMLLFITTIAAQINGNLDNVVIGAIVGSAAVAVYSMGLLIFNMFEQLSVALSGVMLPTVTQTLKGDDEKYTATQKLIVRVGRIQFILLGAALSGFIVLGKPFIELWLGAGFEDVYIIVLILMVPSLLELCVNVCLSVLRAENKLLFRTVILLATTALNAIVTIVGTYFWNYYAAAIGTALSFLIGSVLIMNVYYHRKLGFNMLKMYRNIIGKTWICLVLAGAGAYIGSLFTSHAGTKMIIGVLAFVIVYAGTLWMLGLSSEEKAQILKRGKR